MKTLLFLRHGKSDWDADFSVDHERPLKKRGRVAAQAMGRFLVAVDQLPDRILCSSALRARQTLDEAATAGGWPVVEMDVTRALYDARPDAVLDVIRSVQEPAQRLLLVGHEPTWSLIVSALVEGGVLRFPTAALARVDVDVMHWHDVREGLGELVWLIPPRLFTDTALDV